VLAGVALGMGCLALTLTEGAGLARASTTGQVEHWGTFAGQGSSPGTGDTSLTPVSITLPGTVVQVATSNSSEYALLSDGEVYAWGQGTDGELGDGGNVNSFTTPVQVRFPAGVTIASLAPDTMPFDAALAVDTTGHAWGWGLNEGGEFCLGNAQSYATPVELPFSGVTALAGAYNHATYDANGTLYSCGDNAYGDLGDGLLASSHVPVRVKNLPGSAVVSLVASFGNAGALLRDGKYFDWGMNGQGQLGNGTTVRPSPVPVQVSLPGPVVQVAQGGSLPGNGQTLVMLANGALYSWGADTFGQLGTGKQKVAQPAPAPFSPPAGVTYKTLASGGGTSYAISTAGNVYAWGSSNAGQAGDGSTQTVLKPVLVTSGAVSISATADNAAVSIG
jgi:alpha-tubulin suppressor-like RCC1 family protein